MSFCQIVLKASLVNNVINDPYNLNWREKVEAHQKKFPNDPLPFPFDDPDPQCYFPFTKSNPWHTQIHRDAFGYGEVPPTIDQRLVVDFRWFTYSESRKENYVEFSGDVRDEFGMPQVSNTKSMGLEDQANGLGCSRPSTSDRAMTTATAASA